MAYVRDMLNAEEENRKKLEEILNDENTKKIVLRAGQYVDNETAWSLKKTKALLLEYMSNTDDEYNNRESWGELLLSAHDKPMGINVTTWSSLIRNVIDILRPQIDVANTMINSEEFRATFDKCLNNILTRQDFKLNANCPKRLYKEAEETDLIHSVVYMNSKNHFIPIITDEQGIEWGFCAVYTGEIVRMLEALLDTIHYMFTEYRNADDTMPYHTFVITYRPPKEDNSNTDDDVLQEDISDVNNEILNQQLSKDLIQVQVKLVNMQAMSAEIYNDIENIQKKYGLKLLNEFLK